MLSRGFHNSRDETQLEFELRLIPINLTNGGSK